MTDPRRPDLLSQITCIEREIRFREHVYPRRVSVGKMGVNQAREELELMRAVLQTLQELDSRTRLL